MKSWLCERSRKTKKQTTENSTDAYQPDKIMARITEIEKDAGITEIEPGVAASAV